MQAASARNLRVSLKHQGQLRQFPNDFFLVPVWNAEKTENPVERKWIW